MIQPRPARIAVATVPGDPNNVKITTLFDLANADARMGGPGD
jgi:2-C-methyl-D-erythritol 4-phosphate cytidylyltransferase